MAPLYDYEYYENPPSYDEVNNDFVIYNHPSYQYEYEYYDPSAKDNIYPELPQSPKESVNYDDINSLILLIPFYIWLCINALKVYCGTKVTYKNKKMKK